MEKTSPSWTEAARRAVGCGALCGCLAVCAGCSPRPIEARGRVTLDGRPLDEAGIQFIPLAAPGRKAGTEVHAGNYQLDAEGGLLPGRYRVELVDLPPLKLGHAAPAELAKRRRIPPRYAEQSPLVVEITREDRQRGGAQLDFDLRSGP